MIRKLFTALFVSFGLTAVTFQVSHAQGNASELPKAAMDVLANMKGEWSIQARFSPDDGKTWQDSEPNRVSVMPRQKGLMISEIPLEPEKPGFHMESHITYDQYRKVYRMAAIDDYWGIMDVYEGNMIDGQLVLTNLKSGTFFPVAAETWRAFRITLELAAGKRMMIVDKSDDGGKSWQPNFEITYTAL